MTDLVMDNINFGAGQVGASRNHYEFLIIQIVQQLSEKELFLLYEDLKYRFPEIRKAEIAEMRRKQEERAKDFKPVVWGQPLDDK